jgi:hypothetical protein
MNRATVTDLYFMEARAKLLELAAFLDRLERSEGADDFRVKSLRAALRELAEPGSEKARLILTLLSDPTTEPASAAGGKAACGAWPGF